MENYTLGSPPNEVTVLIEIVELVRPFIISTKDFFSGFALIQIGDIIQNRGIKGCRHGLSSILGPRVVLRINSSVD